MHRDSFSKQGLGLQDGSGVEIFQLKHVSQVKGTISVVSFPFSEQVTALIRLQRSYAGHGGFFRAVHTSWFLSWSRPSLCVFCNKTHPNLKGFFRSVNLTWGIVSRKFRLWLAWFWIKSQLSSSKTPFIKWFMSRAVTQPWRRPLGPQLLKNVNNETWRVFLGCAKGHPQPAWMQMVIQVGEEKAGGCNAYYISPLRIVGCNTAASEPP